MTKEKHKHATLLMQSLSFTDADLKANREGNMSRQQQQQLARKQRGFFFICLVMLIIAGVFSGIGGYLLWLPRANDDVGQIALGIITGGIALVMFAITLFMLWAGGIAYQQDLAAGRVSQITGQIVTRTRRYYQSIQFEISIADQTFSITTKVYISFVNGKTYHIYYAPNTRFLIAAELVPDEV